MSMAKILRQASFLVRPSSMRMALMQSAMPLPACPIPQITKVWSLKDSFFLRIALMKVAQAVEPVPWMSSSKERMRSR